MPPEERERVARREPAFRSGINVAKSLAVDRDGVSLFGQAREEKYAFMFDEEVSSRREKVEDTEPDSFRMLNKSG